MDWLDLLVVQGTLKSLLQHQNSKASILLCSAFFVVQLSICMVVMVVYSCIKNRTKHRNNRREGKKRMGTYRILRNFWARFKWSDVTKYIIQDKLSYAEVTKNTSACECPHSCLTLCDPMDCSMPGLPVITNSRSLLELMSIELVMTSNRLILCHPLLLPPSIFPSIRVFSNE